MLAISCRGCGTQVFAECEATPDQPTCGKASCAHRSPNTAFATGAPQCTCCPEDHDHEVLSCPGNGMPPVVVTLADGTAHPMGPHPGEPCPFPAHQCPVWEGLQPHKEDSHERDLSLGPCPGGHCAKGVNGCLVCTSLIISLVPGSVTLRPVVS